MAVGVAEVGGVQLASAVVGDRAGLDLEGDSSGIHLPEGSNDVVDLEDDLRRRRWVGWLSHVEGDLDRARIEEGEEIGLGKDLETHGVAIELDCPAHVGDTEDDV